MLNSSEAQLSYSALAMPAQRQHSRHVTLGDARDADRRARAAAVSVELKHGGAGFVWNMGLLSITVTAEGYQPGTVYSPAQILMVTLQADWGSHCNVPIRSSSSWVRVRRNDAGLTAQAPGGSMGVRGKARMRSVKLSTGTRDAPRRQVIVHW
jgi:hypothetical protein